MAVSGPAAVLATLANLGTPSSQSQVVTLQNAATTTGNGTPLPVQGQATALLAVQITGSASINWVLEGPDGNTYPIIATNLSYGGSGSGASSSGLYAVPVVGGLNLYAEIASIGASSTVTVKGLALPSSFTTPYLQTAIVSANTAPDVYTVVNDHGLATSATTPILASPYTAPWQGTLNVAVGIAAGATATTFLVSTNAGAASPVYLAINQGANLVAGAEYDLSIPVAYGDTINFETGAATTLGKLAAFVVPSQM
jgi:hypothetical protein